MGEGEGLFVFFLGIFVGVVVNMSMSNLDLEIDLKQSFIVQTVYQEAVDGKNICRYQFEAQTMLGEDFYYKTECGSYKVGDRLFSINTPNK